MKLIVRGKNIDITEALKDYVEKRIGKIDKYFEGAGEAQVNLGVIKEDHIVEVTVTINGIILRGEESTGDMYASIDQVVEKLEKQIEKHKTKLNRKLRTSGIKLMNQTMVSEDRKTQEEEPQVVKTKRFTMKPMPVGEAILQMELVGHNFFVYNDAETEQVNVVYRRKDGNYGLIEPDI